MIGYSKVKISVTRDIIDRSVPQCTQHCMIANAISPHLASNVKITVYGQSFRIFRPMAARHFELPDAVIAQIARFDNWEPVHPFEFELILPDLYLAEEDPDRSPLDFPLPETITTRGLPNPDSPVGPVFEPDRELIPA